MARSKIFTMRCSEKELALIAQLADLLRRNQSDAVRYLLFNNMMTIRSNENPNQLKDEADANSGNANS
jgi:hypothetical protein